MRGRPDDMSPSFRALFLPICLVACNSGGDPADSGARPASDAATPPLAEGIAGSYKGLPLGLVNNGKPGVDAVDGKIGVVCIGMSNGNQECADFIERLGSEYRAVVNPAVVVVNCAVGGHAIEKWNDPSYDSQLWNRCLDTRVPAAGLRTAQVRVIWHKAANQFTTGPNGAALPLYPAAESDYAAFMRNLTTFSTRLKSFFPSVEVVYATSRSYGGYGSANRGEPLSYEEGHALNSWLRENPRVDGVLYTWGPYIWAPDCATGGTNGAGICYERSDYVQDGVHPSLSGRAKVSAQLHGFLLTQPWYRK